MKIRTLAMLALIILTCPPAFASSQVGKIANIYTMDNGVVLFDVVGARAGPIPSCASGLPNRWALNGSTAAGQVKVANLLTAFSMKTTVYVFGKDTCVSWGDTEEVDFFNNVLP